MDKIVDMNMKYVSDTEPSVDVKMQIVTVPKFEIDDTLTKEGAAADAKAVGDIVSVTFDEDGHPQNKILEEVFSRQKQGFRRVLGYTHLNGEPTIGIFTIAAENAPAQPGKIPWFKAPGSKAIDPTTGLEIAPTATLQVCDPDPEGEFDIVNKRWAERNFIKLIQANFVGPTCSLDGGGNYNVLLGQGLKHNADRHNQTFFGLFNEPVGAPNGTLIFGIGNGIKEENRKNAFEVYFDGRAKVNGAPRDENDVVRLKELNAISVASTDVQINGESITENGVANIPIAAPYKVGLAWGANGLYTNANGWITIDRASEDAISSKSECYKPIVPVNLDYAIRAGLISNGAIKPEDRANICDVIGAMPNSIPTIRNYGDAKLLTFDSNGDLKYSSIVRGYSDTTDKGVFQYTIPMRNENGVVMGLEPGEGDTNGLTPKSYVDRVVANAGKLYIHNLNAQFFEIDNPSNSINIRATLLSRSSEAITLSNYNSSNFINLRTSFNKSGSSPYQSSYVCDLQSLNESDFGVYDVQNEYALLEETTMYITDIIDNVTEF